MSADQPPLIARPAAPTESWIRLPVVECRHLAVTTALIQSAAPRVPSGGRAILLGPGACRELPLAWLASHCGSLTFVDRDLASVEVATSQLRMQTSCRCELRSDDLIGVNAEFLANVDACLAKSSDGSAAAQGLVALAHATNPQPYVDSNGPYDLVIASCVLSQVANALTQGAMARFVERFPNDAQRLAASTEWTEAMFALSERGEAAFIESLVGLLRPGGVLYLSETLRACFVQLHPAGGWQTPGVYRMTRRARLADYFEGRFIVDRQEAWPWVAQPPTAAAPGRLFQVEGAVLRT